MKYFDLTDKLAITSERMFLIAGPCVLESAETNFRIAESVKKICEKLDIDYIFKASFDKANRSAASSFRGDGIDEGLKKLEQVGENFGLPLLTDIHESYQAELAAEVVDILQIPAFLCRQTDLLDAAAKTGKCVNVKKAQFLSAADMKNVVEKLAKFGCQKTMLTERGTTFGYNNLIVDFRGVLEMKSFGLPVIMDATHSTQRPGGLGNASGGNPEYAPYLAKCAAMCGADGFFFEVHPNPSEALSDASSVVALSDFERILTELKQVYELQKTFP